MPVATGQADVHRHAAPARGELWARLADVLSFPTAELVEAYGNGELGLGLRRLVDVLPYELSFDEDAFSGADAGEIESEYIRLFDVPLDGPTVPLYGGIYGGDRRQVMEELLRFYRHFGLSTANADVRDLPDAIPTVLEFLQFLVTIEGGMASADEAATVRAAQREMLERHVTRWTPRLKIRVARRSPPPLYRAAVDLLHELAVAECRVLADR